MPTDCRNLPTILHFCLQTRVARDGVYQWLDFLEKTNCLETATHRHWNGKRGELWCYRFALQVPLRNRDDALRVNGFELVIIDEKTGAPLYRNSLVTNHPITTANVTELTQVGSTCWKIENENNNTLKTKGYHFEHNFGHGAQDIVSVLVTLNLLAFLLPTVQELLMPPNPFQRFSRIHHYMIFDSWDALFHFIEDGLEITPLPP